MEQSLKRKTIIKIAKLYYYGNMSQEQIAKLMGISRPKVSRLLAAANQLNIVQVTVNDPVSHNEENAVKICKHFNMQKVIITPSGKNATEGKENVGRAASKYLDSILSDNLKIGIAWGTTLNSFARAFRPKHQYPNVQIAQIVGAIYTESMNMDGRDLVTTIANKLNCHFSLFHAPLIVRNPILRDLLMEEPSVIDHFKLIENLDVAFVGIGTVDFALKARYIEQEEGDELVSMGIVGDMCGHQLISDGSSPDNLLKNRTLGISLEALHNIPTVVGLAVGNEKTAPALAAIKGGHINMLIIDEIAAISIMQAERIE